MPIYSPVATASYPHFFEPKMHTMAKPGDPPRYSVTLLFIDPANMTPADKAAWDNMRNEVFACADEAFGGRDKVMDMLKADPKKLKLPFKTVDTEKYGDAFKYQIDAWSTQPIGVVGRYAGRDGKPETITDPREIYAGIKVKAELGVYAYPKGNTPGVGKGINLGLQNIQKWDDGPRIDGRTNAADSFSAEQRPEADLGAVTASQAGQSVQGKTTSNEMSDLLG